tara:strand:+ start:53 stop:226 length:174 start_codon:yes stop_codon:yes gene_type:complete
MNKEYEILKSLAMDLEKVMIKHYQYDLKSMNNKKLNQAVIKLSHTIRAFSELHNGDL